MPEIDVNSRDWLTVKEFAELLQVSTGTVRNWVRAGRITADQLSPKIWRIPKTELEKFSRGEEAKA